MDLHRDRAMDGSLVDLISPKGGIKCWRATPLQSELKMIRDVDYSFIIPARNEGVALRETIEHLARLSSEFAIEIIIVDDCSDIPISAVDCSWLRVILHRSDRRMGVSRSRNIGATLASGRVLFFLDAHVCFSDGFLAKVQEKIAIDDVGIVGCTTQIVNDLGQFLQLSRGIRSFDEHRCSRYYGWAFAILPFPDVYPIRTGPEVASVTVPYVGGCALAISRERFIGWTGFDDGLIGYGSLEDAELGMRSWALGNRVELLTDVVCYHYSAALETSTRASKSVSPFEHPRYDGSAQNALRIIYLHFPSAQFADILDRLNRLRIGQGEYPIDCDEFVVPLQSRACWLDSRRRRSRELVLKKLVAEGHPINPRDAIVAADKEPVRVLSE